MAEAMSIAYGSSVAGAADSAAFNRFDEGGMWVGVAVPASWKISVWAPAKMIVQGQ